MNKVSIVIVVSVLFLLQACTTGPNKEEAKQTQDSLLKVQEDSLIALYMSEIEVIDEKLKAISTRNGIFDQSELPENVSKDVILQRVEVIDKMLESNQTELNNLLSKIKSSEVKNNELEGMVKMMRQQISRKEGQIDDLMGLLTDKDMKIDEILLRMDSMRVNNIELSEEVIKLDEELHLVYYVVGEKEELMDKQVLTKSGGLLGIGATKKLDADKLDKSMFTEVDERDLISIPIYSKKAKVVTNHPVESYELILDDEGNPQTLDILDRKMFWSISDYLVIEVKN